MNTSELLNSFVKRCENCLNLKCILQFGSSTYSKKPHDMDIALFSNDSVFTTKDYLLLFKLIREFEKKNKNVAFDIGGGDRKRKAKLKITIVPIGGMDLEIIKSGEASEDSFFFKNLAEDKNKKVLYGNNPLNFDINMSKLQIAEKLSIEVNYTLRKCLDDEKTKKGAIYHLFKTCLRVCLVNAGVPKKEELLNLFKREYSQLKLPKHANSIIQNKIKQEDFEQVLKFSEDCLNFLRSNYR